MSFFRNINRKEQVKHSRGSQTSMPADMEQPAGTGKDTRQGTDSENLMEEETEYEVVEREILPDKIICPDCGGITLEGLEFCDKCGGELL